MGVLATWHQALDAEVNADDYAAGKEPEQAVVEHCRDNPYELTSGRQAMCPGLNDVQAFRYQRYSVHKDAAADQEHGGSPDN